MAIVFCVRKVLSSESFCHMARPTRLDDESNFDHLKTSTDEENTTFVYDLIKFNMKMKMREIILTLRISESVRKMGSNIAIESHKLRRVEISQHRLSDVNKTNLIADDETGVHPSIQA
ncbi:hypothetical protein ElyMa_003078600 [Elysia marginata]|uniref:Uncharacterized protein n=1 Tax=Elysia marginata TaxID=1093978 RepID=A0AAV4ILQ7_9GAST|nr:hypothetical protein ElyMa_003078600 [Elysia marginata]